jgi:hypothetical protein
MRRCDPRTQSQALQWGSLSRSLSVFFIRVSSPFDSFPSGWLPEHLSSLSLSD